MYIPPITIDDIKKLISSTNNFKKTVREYTIGDSQYDYFCIFLSEGNQEMEKQIFENRYLLDRMIETNVAFLYITPVSNNLKTNEQIAINKLRGVRDPYERERAEELIRNSCEAQCQLFMDDACEYFKVKRHDLPALLFVDINSNKKNFPVKSYEDINKGGRTKCDRRSESLNRVDELRDSELDADGGMM